MRDHPGAVVLFDSLRDGIFLRRVLIVFVIDKGVPDFVHSVAGPRSNGYFRKDTAFVLAFILLLGGELDIAFLLAVIGKLDLIVASGHGLQIVQSLLEGAAGILRDNADLFAEPYAKLCAVFFQEAEAVFRDIVVSGIGLLFFKFRSIRGTAVRRGFRILPCVCVGASGRVGGRFYVELAAGLHFCCTLDGCCHVLYYNIGRNVYAAQTFSALCVGLAAHVTCGVYRYVLGCIQGTFYRRVYAVDDDAHSDGDRGHFRFGLCFALQLALRVDRDIPGRFDRSVFTHIDRCCLHEHIRRQRKLDICFSCLCVA